MATYTEAPIPSTPQHEQDNRVLAVALITSVVTLLIAVAALVVALNSDQGGTVVQDGPKDYNGVTQEKVSDPDNGNLYNCMTKWSDGRVIGYSCVNTNPYIAP